MKLNNCRTKNCGPKASKIYVYFSVLFAGAPVKEYLSQKLERVTGIEPVSEAWEASILPLNYTRQIL